MIIYSELKSQFHLDVQTNSIDSKLLLDFSRVLHMRPAKGEIASWRNSLAQMHIMLEGSKLPKDCRVSIEYMPPLTSKRVDFILTGRDKTGRDSLIIIELKQWDQLEVTDKQDIIKTYIGGGNRDHAHPSYQAWTYAQLLQDFCVPVTTLPIQISPCVYMHNLQSEGVIRDPRYQKVLEDAPVFLRQEVEGLRKFVNSRIEQGDDADLVKLIDSGEIKPSKKLADSIAKMLEGNQEFIMIDEQKVVYETIRSLALKRSKSKQVIIVRGGPGTGKSVVAVNLMVSLLYSELNACYVSKNSAPRDVYKNKLASGMRQSRISQLFVSSGSFTKSLKNAFDVLLVDEAHRLNEKSGIMRNIGENQVKETIHASKCAVFFLDEDQRVALSDIGSAEEIERWAQRYDAEVTVLELTSQFRCGGSDGYLSWLDRALQIRETANFDLEGIPYDFKVFESPEAMHAAIVEKNRGQKVSRTVAGYCWDWKSKKDTKATDINIGSFRKQWNLANEGNSWIIRPNSVDEVGCVHTCQGLELEYVGVIIGKDLVVREGICHTNGSARARSDRTISGYKALLKSDPAQAQEKLDKIIKNTYRVLMTRGMKGCYIYSEDQETRDYFKSMTSFD